MARAWSLRTRLLAITATACIAAWLAGGVAVYLAVQRQDAAHFDARLQDLAHSLRVFAGHELIEIDAGKYAAPVTHETAATRQDRYRYQVWSDQGQLLMASANAVTATPLMPLRAIRPETRSIDGRAFRVISVDAPEGRFRVLVAEPVTERGVWHDVLGVYLLGGLGVSAVVLGGLTLLMSQLALRPVAEVGVELGRRGPKDLRAIVQDKLPLEFAPVVAALNALLARIDAAMTSERGFVAAAAHELRTPLAGLRAQAQLAAHPRMAPADREAALKSVLDGVDQASHLVSQLLDLARSDVLAGDPLRLAEEQQPVDLQAVFTGVLDDLADMAAAGSVDVQARFDVPRIVGSAFGIGRVLHNLVANAIAHSPRGGRVDVSTRREGADVVLSVEDAGPGIPAAERERVFERFRRGADTRRSGSGLGLSIVKAIADAHGARLALSQSSLGGLAVRLRFRPTPGRPG